MKTRNIILITIAAVVLISIPVRETRLLELDFYKSINNLTDRLAALPEKFFTAGFTNSLANKE